MSETAVHSASLDAVETVMRDELAQNAVTAASIVPIMRHLLTSDGSSIFSDDVVARVRGMLADVTRQLLDAQLAGGAEGERADHPEELCAELGEALVGNAAFLFHLHALALEWQLADRLQARMGLDPVLTPLLQALIASPEPAVAELAMNLLAAQARFCQSQRRMQLPLGELPGDLLHAALVAMRAIAGTEPERDARAAAAEAAIRASYDEGRNRLGMLARIVTGLGGGAVAALSLTHAGVAIFLSALSIGSSQDRDTTALATNEAQLARFALALRASGRKPEAVDEQFVMLHPEIALPPGFDRLGADRAAALLAVSGSYAGG